jgi:hypothetical protein
MSLASLSLAALSLAARQGLRVIEKVIGFASMKGH